MALHDHFHPPWADHFPWEGLHSAWANTIVRHLNSSVLPRQYRAIPQVHLGAWVEADVAAFERGNGHWQASPTAEGRAGGEVSTATRAPPRPVQTPAIELPRQDVFEVQVLDDNRGMRLAAAVELVSPGNKDRPEHRRAFVAKCAAYLQRQVGLVVVDVVTDRHTNLHQELLRLFDLPESATEFADLHAIAYRSSKDNGPWQLDTWPTTLTVGSPLPTLPLWLTSDLAVPLDLERSYEETSQVLRIP